MPFVVRTVLPVLRGIDPHLHDAAATLGASPVRAWREITVTHLRRPLAAAAGLAAAISLGEFGATSFLSRSGSETMPVAIERLLGRTGRLVQAQGYALATLLAAATVAIVLALDATGDRRSATVEAAMLEIVDLTAGYGERPVLDGVSLTVGDGEVVALLGPSGSGKSTLLRAIAGLLAGIRRAASASTASTSPPCRRTVAASAWCSRTSSCSPTATSPPTSPSGCACKGSTAAQREARVAEMLDLVGLAGYEHRAVTELSGGEAKRVALARSLAPSPRALLLDEPLTGLDRELHDRLAVEVARILREAATTALLVTHDHAEAEAVADRVVTIDELGGTRISVVELATADTYELRRRVLRTGTPSTRRRRSTATTTRHTTHLGLADHRGAVVAISSWTPKPCPDRAHRARRPAARHGRRSRPASAVDSVPPCSRPASTEPSPPGPRRCGRTPATPHSASTRGTASRSSTTGSSTRRQHSRTTASGATRS